MFCKYHCFICKQQSSTGQRFIVTRLSYFWPSFANGLPKTSSASKKKEKWFLNILKIVDSPHIFINPTIVSQQQQVACIVVITIRTNTSSYSIQGVKEEI